MGDWLKRIFRGSRRARPQVSGASLLPVHWWKHLWRRRWLHRRINYKLLAVLVFVLGVLMVSVHFLHAYQIKRNYGMFRLQAEKARKENNWSQLEKILPLYLRMAPQDAEAQFWLGEMLEENARGKRSLKEMISAFIALDRAVQLDPKKLEYRRRVATVALEAGRFLEAEHHLNVLLEAFPDDAELELAAGRCAMAMGKNEDAERRLLAAKQLAPGNIDTYVILAYLYRRKLNQPAAANDCMKEMVEENPESLRARLERARYYRQIGSVAEADRDLRDARRDLAPDDPDVLIASAELAVVREKYQEARDHLKRGLEKNPDHAGLHQSMAGVQMRDGKPLEAIDYLKQAQKKVKHPEELTPLLIEAMIEAKQIDRADAAILDMRQLHNDPHLVGYLEARSLLFKSRWSEGAQLLEQVRPYLPQLAMAVDQLLARAYGQIGDVDRRLEACQRLAALDALSVNARLDLASALLDAGQLNAATEECLKVAGRTPQARVRAAQLLAMQEARLPAARRDWSRVESHLAEADREAPNQIDVLFLRVRVRLAQDKYSEAKQLLEDAVQQNPDPIETRLLLASLVHQKEGAEPALAVLKSAPDRPGVRLARAVYLTPLRPAEARQILEAIEKDLATASADDLPNMLQGLAAAYERLPDPAQAERLWKRLAELLPHNLPVRLRLLDQARRANDLAAMDRLLSEIRGIDGPKGAYSLQGDAARLLIAARRGDASALTAARKHLDDAARIRPHWPRIPLLLAELKELEKDPDSALKHYQHAIKLGERRPEVVTRTVQLLYERRRYAEAGELFKSMQEQTLLTGAVGRMAAEVSFALDGPERALELAQQAVSRDSRDYRHHLWLGQIFLAAGKTAEAEAALRRAVELDGTRPETWIAYIQLLATVDRKRAAAEIDKAAAQLPLASRPLTLAACYEAVGQAEEASKQYQAAFQQSPHDVHVWRAMILFLHRRADYASAEALLRKFLESQKQASADEQLWARRQLAYCLAMTGEQAKFEEALTLIRRNHQGGEPTLDDKRVEALILSTRPVRRAEAIRTLEEIHARQPLAPEEQFRLAQHYEASKNWAKAEEHLSHLLNTARPNPRYLAYYAYQLLKRGDIDKAERQVRLLERFDPLSFGTMTLQARLLAKAQKEREAVDLVFKHVEGSPPQFLPLAASLLEELGQLDGAEKLYERFAAGSDRPENVFLLVQFLAGNGRLPRALDLCDKAQAKCTPEAVALNTVAALRRGKAGPGHFQQVEPRLQEMVKKHSDNIQLLDSLADFYDLQGRYGDAQEIYRTIVKKQDRNLKALNNLAWLSVLSKGNPDDSLKLVQRALDLVGPIPELLDTRGVVLLAGGKADLAVKDLQQAIELGPSPSRYFHLAHAQLRANDRRRAQESLRMAQTMGLQEQTLHPLERESYRQLLSELQ